MSVSNSLKRLAKILLLQSANSQPHIDLFRVLLVYVLATELLIEMDRFAAT